VESSPYLLTKSDRVRLSRQEEAIMDAKYNELVDSLFFRVTTLVAGFAAWLLVTITLLHV
jgi:hypothetical protein